MIKDTSILHRYLFTWTMIAIVITCIGTSIPKLISSSSVNPTTQLLFLLFWTGLIGYVLIGFKQVGNVIASLKSSSHHISLNENDFDCLTRGGILQIVDENNRNIYNVALKDIGFTNMEKSITKAMAGIDIQKNYARKL